MCSQQRWFLAQEALRCREATLQVASLAAPRCAWGSLTFHKWVSSDLLLAGVKSGAR